jgi:hypothetical protein
MGSEGDHIGDDPIISMDVDCDELVESQLPLEAAHVHNLTDQLVPTDYDPYHEPEPMSSHSPSGRRRMNIQSMGHLMRHSVGLKREHSSDSDATIPGPGLATSDQAETPAAETNDGAGSDPERVICISKEKSQYYESFDDWAQRMILKGRLANRKEAIKVWKKKLRDPAVQKIFRLGRHHLVHEKIPDASLLQVAEEIQETDSDCGSYTSSQWARQWYASREDSELGRDSDDNLIEAGNGDSDQERDSCEDSGNASGNCGISDDDKESGNSDKDKMSDAWTEDNDIPDMDLSEGDFNQSQLNDMQSVSEVQCGFGCGQRDSLS